MTRSLLLSLSLVLPLAAEATYDLTYREPDAVVCPRFAQTENNPYFDSMVEEWKKLAAAPVKILDFTKVGKQGVGDKVGFKTADEIQKLVFGLCHPQSPLKADPRLAERFAVLYDQAIRETWGKGKLFCDFQVDQEFPQAYLMVRTAFPNFFTAEQKTYYEGLIRKNAETIVQQKGKTYAEQDVANVWVNSDVRHMVSLMYCSLVLDEPSWRTYAEQALTLIEKTLEPDGGWNYVGYQNEAFSYHTENVPALAWMYLLSRNPLAWRQIKDSAPYFPMIYHPRAVAEFYTPTMMKQYWNKVTPGISAVLAAMASGDGYNLQLAPKDGAHILGAIFYKSGVTPKKAPAEWLVYDRNNVGPRGTYGDWAFAGTTRDASRFPGSSPDTQPIVIGNMGSGLVGCMTLIPESVVKDVDRVWPLSAAMVNPTIEIKVEAGVDEDISRRRKHRFMVQNQRGGTTLAADFGTLGVTYRVSDKTAGADGPLKALPWEGNQLWLTGKNRLVGLLRMTALADAAHFGIHGTLVLVSGRETWGNKRDLLKREDGSYAYGDLVVRFPEASFTQQASEGTDVFTGKAKRSMRLLLANDDPLKDVQATAKAGESSWYLVEVTHPKSPASRNLKKIATPDGLVGFEFEEEGRRIRMVQNVTGAPVAYRSKVEAGNLTVSVRRSTDLRDRMMNKATSDAWTGPKTLGGEVVRVAAGNVDETIPAWEHVVIVASASSADHQPNDSTYADVFK